MKRFFKDNKGVASIEATIALVSFSLALIAIYNFVNYCRIQTIVSNALDASAKELSQYSYFCHVSGIERLNNSLNQSNSNAKNMINNVYGTMQSFYTSIAKFMTGIGGEKYNGLTDVFMDNEYAEEKFVELSTVKSDTKKNGESILAEFDKIEDAIGDIADNPMLYVKAIGIIAGTEGINMAKSYLIAAPFAKAFTVKHFGGNSSTANAFLLKYGVVNGLDGLNFKLSTIFNPDSPQDINLVCCFRLKIASFMGIQFGDVVVAEQSRVHAWLGGDKYNKTKSSGSKNSDSKSSDSNSSNNSNTNTESKVTSSNTSSNTSSHSNNNSTYVPPATPSYESTESKHNSSYVSPSSDSSETSSKDKEPLVNPWITFPKDECTEYIREKEVEKMLENGGYSADSPYVDAYDPSQGLIYYTSVNFTNDMYSDSGERYISEIIELCELVNDVKTKNVTVTDANGVTKTVSGYSTNVILMVYAPEGATSDYVENYQSYLKEKYPNIDVVIVEGYGKAN